MTSPITETHMATLATKPTCIADRRRSAPTPASTRTTRNLLASSPTEDAVVELSRATIKLGMAFPVLEPRQTVVATLAAAVGPLDTSHTLTNLRGAIDGDHATVRCYAQARHFLPGQSPNPARAEHALMMNRYDCSLRRVTSDVARWLLINSPPVFEQLVLSAGRPAPEAELPPTGLVASPTALAAADTGSRSSVPLAPYPRSIRALTEREAQGRPRTRS
jgi:hypothetical protein